MTPYYEQDGITIYHGDCRDLLTGLPNVDVVVTDPPYSVGRAEAEFAASGNIAVSLHMASTKAPTMLVFGTSSGRGAEFLRSSIRALPHCRDRTTKMDDPRYPLSYRGPMSEDAYLALVERIQKAMVIEPFQPSVVDVVKLLSDWRDWSREIKQLKEDAFLGAEHFRETTNAMSAEIEQLRTLLDAASDYIAHDDRLALWRDIKAALGNPKAS